MSNLLVPTYGTGFARYAAECEASGLWHRLQGAWCPFLGPTGEKLYDWSGNNKHGTLTNMDAATDWVAGGDGYALEFDANNDYIDLPAQAFLYPDITVVMRFMTTITGTGQVLFGLTNNDFTDRLYCGIKQTGEVFIYDDINDRGTLIASTKKITDGKWHQAAFVIGSSGREIYLDGESIVTEGDTTGVDEINQLKNSIGCMLQAGPQAVFAGGISSVHIWDRTLCSSEIQQLYIDPYVMWRLADSRYAVGGSALTLALSDSISASDSIAKSASQITTDILSASDSVAKSVSQIVSDSISVSDSIVRGASQIATDVLSVSDSFVIDFSQIISDSISTSDNIVLDYSQVFTDVLTVLDSLVFDSSISFSDLFNVITDVCNTSLVTPGDIETVVGLVDIASVLAKPFDETQPWMPFIAIGSSTLAENEVTDTELWEELYRKEGEVRVVRNTYFVKATFGQDEPTADDLSISEIGIFDANADGVLGRRWVLVTPVVKDNIDEIVVECAITMLHGTLVTLGGSSVIDAVGISDSLLLERGLDLDDIFAMSELLALNYNKGFDDIFAMSELLALNYNKDLDDIFAMSELLALNYNKGFDDTFAMSELLALNYNKGFDDTFAIGGNPAPTYGLGSMVLGTDILGELKLRD
jgi:hypothetical protein